MTITANRFDPLKRFVGVRLQQGVPIVDADENEREDIRKFELRAFLKWFVGNGVPEGSRDAFRIIATADPSLPANHNNFLISAGVPDVPPGANNFDKGLRHVGRLLVDGLDILIEPPGVKYSQQPALPASTPALPLLTLLSTPTAAEVITVFVDVWERLVLPSEDPKHMIYPGLGGSESCARLMREWRMRWRTGTALPGPGEDDYRPNHSYYAVARIARRDSDPTVQPSDITDLREQRLLVPPATLIEDVFGGTPEAYRQGKGRPPISLRTAINALLRGELPGTIERDVAPPATSDDLISRGIFFDQAGGLVAVWGSNRQGGVSQVFAARDAHPGMPDSWFGPPQQVTTGVKHEFPHAIGLPGGMLVIYQQEAAAGAIEVQMRQGTLAADGTLTLKPAVPVAGATGVLYQSPFVVPLAGGALLLWHRTESNSNRWQFNRAVLGVNGVSLPAAPTDLAPATTQRDLHAAADLENSTWVAFRTTDNKIQALEVPPADVSRNPMTLDSGAGAINQAPFVLVANDFVWVFWSGKDNAIWYRRFNRADSTWESAPVRVDGTEVGTTNGAPTAVTDAEGTIWLFWHSNRRGNQQDIWYARRPKDAAVWGDFRPLTTRAEPDRFATVLRGEAGRLWLLWQRDFGAQRRILSKQVFTTL